MQIFFIIGIPILLSLGSFLFKRQSVFTVINACGYFTVLLESAILLKNAVFNNILISYFNFIYVDALSAFFIFVTSVVAFAAAVYSIGYINGDLKKALISERKSRLYYLLFNHSFTACSFLFRSSRLFYGQRLLPCFFYSSMHS